MSNRKARTEITRNLLKIFRKFLDENITLKEITSRLDISYATGKKIARNFDQNPNYLENYVQCQTRVRRQNNGIKDAIMSILNYENQYIQFEIKHELSRMGFNVSQSTICRAIREINFSRKRLTVVPVKKNTRSALEARRLYAQRISQIRDEKLIFFRRIWF